MAEKIVMACDHAGYLLREVVKKHLQENGFEVDDCGTWSEESVDYPDFAHKVGKAVNNGEVERGIVICGSGNGVQMTVNKYPNVRCALCWCTEIARLARQHNDANVLSLPARFIDQNTALDIVDCFIANKFLANEERHVRRVAKIRP